MDMRAKGLAKLVGGVLVYVILFSTVLKNGLGDPAHGGPFKLIVLGVPGAFLLSGLIELVTGAPFQHVAEKWDMLQGWQRGIFGILIVVLAIIAMMGAVVMFG